jgi:hypothetical protein
MVRNDDANLPKEFRRLNADLSIRGFGQDLEGVRSLGAA